MFLSHWVYLDYKGKTKDSADDKVSQESEKSNEKYVTK